MTREEAERARENITSRLASRGISVELGIEDRAADWFLVYQELPCLSCGKPVRIYEDFGLRSDAGNCQECRENPPMVTRKRNGRAEELDEQFWRKDA